MSSSAVLKRPTSPRRITVPAVRAALQAVIDEHPRRADRRVEDGLSARYIDRGRPNCLVAMVLTKLGFSTGVLRALDQEHPTGELRAVGVKVDESRHPALRKIDPTARKLLQYVQDAQDCGKRWDRILSEAFSSRPWIARRWDQKRKPWLHGPV